MHRCRNCISKFTKFTSIWTHIAMQVKMNTYRRACNMSWRPSTRLMSLAFSLTMSCSRTSLIHILNSSSFLSTMLNSWASYYTLSLFLLNNISIINFLIFIFSYVSKDIMLKIRYYKESLNKYTEFLEMTWQYKLLGETSKLIFKFKWNNIFN